MSAPMRTEGIDNASSILLPYYDQDTKIMYLAGKVSLLPQFINLQVIIEINRKPNCISFAQFQLKVEFYTSIFFIDR